MLTASSVWRRRTSSAIRNPGGLHVKDRKYAQYFGFTEEETKTMLEYYGLELNEEVKAMYNGYRFGDEEIYNPWSVLNYASRRALEPYWVLTRAATR